METITVHQLKQLQEQGSHVDLIDVRMPTEFREVHAERAQNFPLDSLDPEAITAARNGQSNEPLYVICKSGNRSGKAVEKFLGAGITNVVNVDGGTTAWIEAGLPVVRGKKAVSLERQVRILAGLLVLVGAVLGYFVHPAFNGLSGFIGAGLMFAGITDTCGMGMMLSKMPWNRCGDTGSCPF
ncbi:Inner membrane protein YgaP [Novipirellula galeiformis]|uniref:Inner membrane protein YgaP n=1 Tax=Novipirellula galeiformis TaxID=2528004 RepID=A0A5C6CNK8_9BACT|nr:rhodanese-like domain-containing protein [Novipirellula galeiformis]TWU25197.1 Inner membrane protein YgaP [Novipirellula galeiformis]